MKRSGTIMRSCLLLMAFAGVFTSVWAAESRRDPFTPLIVSEPPGSVTELEPLKEVSNPLAEYDIKQLRVIGIVLGQLGEHAILLAPDGKSYMIPVGARIGKFDGVVTAISTNSVRVKERKEFSDGKTTFEKEEETELKLNPLEKDRTQPESRFVVY